MLKSFLLSVPLRLNRPTVFNINKITQEVAVMKKSIFKLLLISTVITLSLAATTTQASSLSQQVTTATVLPQPRTLNAFTLTDSTNQPFTNQNLSGHWTFLFFGFTQCGSICPTTMASLKQIYANLQADKQKLPQVVFISLDPERDTLPIIHQYVTGFDPSFQGATGSQKELTLLTQQLSVLYMKVKDPSPTAVATDYQIDHSGALLLINPKGALAAVFSMPHDPSQIAKDYTKIVG